MSRLLILTLLAACTAGTDSDETDPVDTGVVDTDRPDRVTWTVAEASSAQIGPRPRLQATPDGGLFALAFSTQVTTNGQPCASDNSAEQSFIDLHLLSWAGDAWTDAVIASPGVPLDPLGAALAVDDAGQPWVAWADGEPLPTWCGGHDLVLRAPDGSVETVVRDSGEAATGMPASDAGSVVGLWPDLAFDADGNPAIAYRDAHFGALQRDDRYRSDAELAWRTGGWSKEAVDPGAGAGDHNRIVFDSEDRPVVATILPIIKVGDDRQGVWIARKDGADWERTRVHAGIVDDHLDLIALPGGDLLLVLYVPDEASAVAYRYSGGSWDTWERSWLARDGWVEGENVVADVLSDGRLVLAWHTCRRLGGDEGTCDVKQEGPSLAIEQPGGAFEVERVYVPEVGACGRELDLAVVDDVPHLTFSCQIPSFETRLFHAFRDEAP